MDRKIQIPSDAVISWKTLTKSGDEIIWENGENRILFQKNRSLSLSWTTKQLNNKTMSLF